MTDLTGTDDSSQNQTTNLKNLEQIPRNENFEEKTSFEILKETLNEMISTTNNLLETLQSDSLKRVFDGNIQKNLIKNS